MSNYHVGCGLAGIYAGTWKTEKDSNDGFHEWKNKSLITDEAIHAVMTYLLPKKGEVATAKVTHSNGKTVRLTVEWEDEI